MTWINVFLLIIAFIPTCFGDVNNNLEINLDLAAKKLDNYWLINIAKWEVFQAEANSRREKAKMKMTKLAKRDSMKFDWTVLAGLDHRLTAHVIYDDAYILAGPGGPSSDSMICGEEGRGDKPL